MHSRMKTSHPYGQQHDTLTYVSLTRLACRQMLLKKHTHTKTGCLFIVTSVNVSSKEPCTNMTYIGSAGVDKRDKNVLAQ